MNENMNKEVMETVVEDFEVTGLDNQESSKFPIGGLIAGIAGIGIGAALLFKARKDAKELKRLREENLELSECILGYDEEEEAEVLSGEVEETEK